MANIFFQLCSKLVGDRILIQMPTMPFVYLYHRVAVYRLCGRISTMWPYNLFCGRISTMWPYNR